MDESERSRVGIRNRRYAETYLRPDILLEKMIGSIESEFL